MLFLHIVFTVYSHLRVTVLGLPISKLCPSPLAIHLGGMSLGLTSVLLDPVITYYVEGSDYQAVWLCSCHIQTTME